MKTDSPNPEDRSIAEMRRAIQHSKRTMAEAMASLRGIQNRMKAVREEFPRMRKD